MRTGAPIYLLSGMTPDERIFERLVPLLPNGTIVQWLEPHANESLVAYAQRTADTIPTFQCFVGGVSFGGIVGLEVSRLMNPCGCFLISSIRNPRQLPPWLRVFRWMAGPNCSRALSMIGRITHIAPRSMRTHATARAAKLAGPAGAWHRWATSAVLGWKPTRTSPTFPI
jgi:hypothetical protein